MDERAPGPPIVADAPRRRSRWLPFWALQLTEIVVALVFVDISIHVNSAGLLVGSAILLLVLAATAEGPLGIARICRPRLHLVLVVVVAVAIALAPVIPSLRPGIQGIIVLEFGAVGLIRLATLTRVPGAEQAMPLGGHRRSSVIDTTATVGPSPATTEDQRAGRPSASGGSSRPSSGTAADDAARWAGRTAAAAAASGKEAAARYRPEAEAQVKRTIRGAGRLAGKIASRWNPPGDHPR